MKDVPLLVTIHKHAHVQHPHTLMLIISRMEEEKDFAFSLAVLGKSNGLATDDRMLPVCI